MATEVCGQVCIVDREAIVQWRILHSETVHVGPLCSPCRRSSPGTNSVAILTRVTAFSVHATHKMSSHHFLYLIPDDLIEEEVESFSNNCAFKRNVLSFVLNFLLLH